MLGHELVALIAKKMGLPADMDIGGREAKHPDDTPVTGTSGPLAAQAQGATGTHNLSMIMEFAIYAAEARARDVKTKDIANHVNDRYTRFAHVAYKGTTPIDYETDLAKLTKFINECAKGKANWKSQDWGKSFFPSGGGAFVMGYFMGCQKCELNPAQYWLGWWPDKK
jgi:hypothetical protein